MLTYVSEMGVAIRPEFANEFQESYQQVMEKATNQPGFISLQALRVLNDRETIRYGNYVKFETLEDMDRWARDGFHKQIQREGHMKYFSSFYIRKGKELGDTEEAEGKILLETTIELDSDCHDNQPLTSFQKWISDTLSAAVAKHTNILPFETQSGETMTEPFLWTKASFAFPKSRLSQYVILTYWPHTNDCTEWEQSEFHKKVEDHASVVRHKRFHILQPSASEPSASRCPFSQ